MNRISIIGASIVASSIMVTTVSANDGLKPLSLTENVTSAMVVDATTGQILATKNVNKQGPIASQSKMLTAYAVLRGIHEGKIKWTDQVPITKKSDLSREDGHLFSHLAVKAGDKLTVRELYNTVFAMSANDASFALGEYMTPKGMSTQEALQMWAKELHLTGSKWYNAAGQVNSNAFENQIKTAPADAANMASAEQLAIMAREILRLDPGIRELAKLDYITYHLTPSYVVKEPTDQSVLRNEHLSKMSNPNNLVFEGLKTGSTPESGAAFTGIVKDTNGHEFITVVNGAGDYMDEVQRYQITLNIVNDVLAEKVPISYQKNSTLPSNSTLNLKSMKKNHMPVTIAKTKTFWADKKTDLSIKTTVKSIKNKHVKKGQIVGGANITSPDISYLPNTSSENKSIMLVAKQSTTRANWLVRSWRAIFQ